MTTEIRREIAVMPPQVKLVEHVRHVYALPSLRAPRDAHADPHGPGSMVSPSAMAHIM